MSRFAHTWASKEGGNFKCKHVADCFGSKLTQADSDEIKKRFEEDPKFYLSYCKAIESELNVRFKLIMKGTPEAKAAKDVRHGLRYNVHRWF